MNYTDVDDKTIAGSVSAGKPLREYTEEWVNAFRSDAEQLGIETPEHTPRATDDANMQAMCDMIARARAERPYLPARRIDLLQDRLPADLRTSGAARSGRPPRWREC